HRTPVQPHHPDPRPGANYGYMEIADVDESAAVLVTMAPGDLLVFHSFLWHKSVDNRSQGRRAAMVCHYGRTGTRNLADNRTQAVQNQVLHWRPAFRETVPA
ncbi:MAG: phytanoyl-CoA dioxygenase family protein, partial [Chloroflexota bacterium]